MCERVEAIVLRVAGGEDWHPALKGPRRRQVRPTQHPERHRALIHHLPTAESRDPGVRPKVRTTATRSCNRSRTAPRPRPGARLVPSWQRLCAFAPAGLGLAPAGHARSPAAMQASKQDTRNAAARGRHAAKDSSRARNNSAGATWADRIRGAALQRDHDRDVERGRPKLRHRSKHASLHALPSAARGTTRRGVLSDKIDTARNTAAGAGAVVDSAPVPRHRLRTEASKTVTPENRRDVVPMLITAKRCLAGSRATGLHRVALKPTNRKAGKETVSRREAPGAGAVADA